jgi:trimeric autotransporter adhesin
MAAELAVPGGPAAVLGGDPLADPLDGLLGLEEGMVAASAAGDDDGDGNTNRSLPTSNNDPPVGSAAAAAAAAVAAADAAGARALGVARDIASLDAATQTDAGAAEDVEAGFAALVAALRTLGRPDAPDAAAAVAAAEAALGLGRTVSSDDGNDALDNDQDDDYDTDPAEELAWLERDPQLRALVQAGNDAFAAALREEDEDAGNDASAGGAGGAGGGGGRAGALATQGEAWDALQLEDWLDEAEAAGAGTSTAGATACAEQDAGSDGNGSGGGSSSGLAGVLDAIEADPTMSQQEKLAATLSVAGMFNSGARGAADAKAAMRSSKPRGAVRNDDDDDDDDGAGSWRRAGSNSSGDDAPPPALLPRPQLPQPQ